VRPAYSQARIPPRRAPPTSSLSLTLSCAVLAFHDFVALGRRLDRMGRNRGFTAALIQIQREAERQRNAELAATTRAARDAERAHRAYERAQTAEAKGTPATVCGVSLGRR
jgi:hypothetical protein